jgi:transcriptional regulator with XRE-family HTH domain
VYTDQAAILRRVLTREGITQQELANKLDLTRQWLERAIGGGVALGAESCLRIALEFREDALQLLRAAGKDELADLLKRAGFGAGEMSATDRDLLRDLDSVPEAQQRPIRELIRSLSARDGSPTRKSRRRS